MKTLKVKKLNKNSTLPSRGHPHDAGLDLYASEQIGYKATDVLIVVPTSIAVGIEPGYVGMVCDKSSISLKGLKVTAGIIDAGYTGEANVVILNLSGKAGCVVKGSKIAQLLVIPVALPTITEVDALESSARGTGGFGSTGA